MHHVRNLNYQPTTEKSMRMISKFIGILLGLWLGILPLHASTINAASSSYSDVAAAVSAASAGDTVIIPAGTSTWSSTLSITKSVYLVGSGTNSTHLISAGDFIDIKPATDAPVRVSGIWFEEGAGSSSSITLEGKCTQFRIDHCLFTGSGSVGVGYGKRCIFPNGWIYG